MIFPTTRIPTDRDVTDSMLLASRAVRVTKNGYSRQWVVDALSRGMCRRVIVIGSSDYDEVCKFDYLHEWLSARLPETLAPQHSNDTAVIIFENFSSILYHPRIALLITDLARHIDARGGVCLIHVNTEEQLKYVQSWSNQIQLLGCDGPMHNAPRRSVITTSDASVQTMSVNATPTRIKSMCCCKLSLSAIIISAVVFCCLAFIVMMLDASVASPNELIN